jgi:integrase
VFWSPGNGTQACQGKRFTLDDARFGRVWRSIRKRAGLEGLWPDHGELIMRDLRRTHATWMIVEGANPVFLAQRLGHRLETQQTHYVDVQAAVRQGVLRKQELFDGIMPTAPAAPAAA